MLTIQSLLREPIEQT